MEIAPAGARPVRINVRRRYPLERLDGVIVSGGDDIHPGLYGSEELADKEYDHDRDELEQRLAVLMGGRAAEYLVFGHLSTGAADDLARATQIAREMVTRFAMVPELGNRSFVDDGPNHLGLAHANASTLYSDQTAEVIDRAIQEIVDAARACAERLLQDNRELLERSAQSLLERETLDENEIAELFGEVIPFAKTA